MLALCLAMLSLHAAACAADKQKSDDFAFPPEIAAQEEAAAQDGASGTTAAPPAAPAEAHPAPAAPAPAVVPAENIPASSRPLRPVDYSLAPETLDAANPGRTPLQKMLQEYAADGKSSTDDLVKLLSSGDGDQLDHIVINIATQRIYECNASGQVLHEEPVSTGMKGLDTPTGDYTVHNKAPKAYSQKYTAWMLQWMALTGDGSYGMHGLEGSAYERRLGHQASHGCVRLSRKYAKELYPRVKVGLPVKIVNDKDLKLAVFQPLSEQAARAQVMDFLSPADPDALFY
jgi:lipoprotein-anchoring transpeptidase ErfK/SrfK